MFLILVSLKEMAELIEIPFVVLTYVDSRNHVVDGFAYGCQLLNPIE